MLLFKVLRVKRKTVFGFKYIRFKSSSSGEQKIKTNEVVASRSNKLSEILDCSKHTARELISKNNNILVLDADDFIRNATFCAKHFRFSDIIEFPWLISLESSLLQHRYFSLKELGCLNIAASHILRFPQIIKKTPTELAKENIYFHQNDEFDYFMSFLSDATADDRNEIKQRFQKMYSDDSTLWKIKESMNAEFLASKLDCSLYKAHHMFHRYPPLRVQSVLNTTNLIDLLFQRLNFSISKVTHVPSILSLHHEIAEQFLEKTPDILGINTVEMVQKLPVILRRPADTVQEVEEILKKYNISDKQLLCCPKIVTFTPRTLKQRLEYLCSSEEFTLMHSYKKFLWLVYHYNNIKPRIEILKALDIPFSINYFIVTDTNFKKYLTICKYRSHINDVVHYLAQVFKQSDKEITIKLKEFQNVHKACLANTVQVMQFLLETGVSKQQIYNGLGIITYDIDVVKEYFKELPNHPSCQPFQQWLTHYYLVRLLIYTIEADRGFKPDRSCESFTKSNDNECALSSYSY
ncbi:hypothetical protein TNIN_128691 [Trichonephila inaurata madagascariensis]|uniref:Uncharacterized protein n=1 Tax=Trichonephila inaurata madagascariensis TaxID=2747483 RepID=A0A8X6YRN7_9ARAC|nr:hypothetical protein TNIN_128691 [Trichonephila inaurata madagascariensis]